MPIMNQKIAEAAEAMMKAGYTIKPSKVYQIFNMEELEIFAAYARHNGLPGLVTYTPAWEDEPVKFQAF